MQEQSSKMEAAKARQGELISAAIAVRENAYAPYSRFRVGAAVLGGSGRIYSGCNVENASYGLTICAERVAIGCAVAAGEKDIVAVAIVASDDLVRPCGACLQVLSEFSMPNDPVAVISAGLNGSTDIRSLSAYLPIQFHLDVPGGNL